MFVIKKLDRKKIIIVGIIAIVLTLITVTLFSMNQRSLTAYCDNIGSYQLEITEDFKIENFFKQFDLEINPSSVQKVSITIPSEFNKVYERYNQLQLSQGLDLSNYKGENVERYTYDVTNYPSGADVKANVIILNNKVIAGDLCTVSLNGVMTTLDDKTITQE